MDAFWNRITKNEKERARLAKRVGTACYRVYDRDIPEFPFVVERLGPALLISSFARDPDIAARVFAAGSTIATIFGVEERHIAFRERVRQKGTSQYNRLDEAPLLVEAMEHDLRFEINLTQYLDVGLFCDHRKSRMAVRQTARDKRCLNLFCYTGSVSVAMAAGGARSVHSMDMSRTYLDWAQRNFKLNGLETRGRHLFDQQDVTGWLRDSRGAGSYDLIFLDPPSFSNSKRMAGTFDVQRDHEWLLRATLGHLSPEGLLFFSTNLTSFKPDFNTPKGMIFQEVTELTQSRDFRRRSAHRSYLLSRSAESVGQFVATLRALGPEF